MTLSSLNCTCQPAADGRRRGFLTGLVGLSAGAARATRRDVRTPALPLRHRLVHASPALAALTRLVNVSQVLFGREYPYRTGIDHVKGIADFGFSPADLRAIGRDNAVRLMPRWGA